MSYGTQIEATGIFIYFVNIMGFKFLVVMHLLIKTIIKRLILRELNTYNLLISTANER